MIMDRIFYQTVLSPTLMNMIIGMCGGILTQWGWNFGVNFVLDRKLEMC